LVQRHLRIATAFLAALAAGLLLAGAFAMPASANSTRVAISDFKWSNPNPQVNLGESVTWDWIGPDTQHSVTGQPPNATQWDSDPGSVNGHPLGDSFTVKFDQPGSYLFFCRLHTSVRGTVVVNNVPGDPNSDPGPQAPLNFDLEPPFVDGIKLGSTTLGPRGVGTTLEFATNERGNADADYYKLVKRGKKTVKRFAGYATWDDLFIGINKVAFAAKSKTFKAKPGKYEAQFRVSDQRFNTTQPLTLQFQINKTTKKKKK